MASICERGSPEAERARYRIAPGRSMVRHHCTQYGISAGIADPAPGPSVSRGVRRARPSSPGGTSGFYDAAAHLGHQDRLPDRGSTGIGTPQRLSPNRCEAQRGAKALTVAPRSAHGYAYSHRRHRQTAPRIHGTTGHQNPRARRALCEGPVGSKTPEELLERFSKAYRQAAAYRAAALVSSLDGIHRRLPLEMSRIVSERGPPLRAS